MKHLFTQQTGTSRFPAYDIVPQRSKWRHN